MVSIDPAPNILYVRNRNTATWSLFVQTNLRCVADSSHRNRNHNRNHKPHENHKARRKDGFADLSFSFYYGCGFSFEFGFFPFGPQPHPHLVFSFVPESIANRNPDGPRQTAYSTAIKNANPQQHLKQMAFFFQCSTSYVVPTYVR